MDKDIYIFSTISWSKKCADLKIYQSTKNCMVILSKSQASFLDADYNLPNTSSETQHLDSPASIYRTPALWYCTDFFKRVFIFPIVCTSRRLHFLPCFGNYVAKWPPIWLWLLKGYVILIVMHRLIGTGNNRHRHLNSANDLFMFLKSKIFCIKTHIFVIQALTYNCY